MNKRRVEVPVSSLTLAFASGLCSLVLSATGCGAQQSQTSDSGTPSDAGRECSVYDEGKPRACTCSSGAVGTQACLEGKYQPCKCSSSGGSGSGSTTPSQGLCKAGFYSGEFSGLYKPGAFGLGIIEGPIEFNIEGSGAGGYPALSFTLLESAEGDIEFGTHTVKNGCMFGSAKVRDTNTPFVARIDGGLDCKTGAFNGTIAGQYDLVGLHLLKYDFSGSATGQFQLALASISDGLWNVAESNALLGQPAGGGGGTWSAVWESETAPAGKDPCSAALSGGADAGTADAGP
jgi:hypothetical protein